MAEVRRISLQWQCWPFSVLGAVSLLALSCLSAGSQPVVPGGFSVRTWDAENGLPHATITAVACTPDGYIWVGTSAGLARFDGIRFVLLTTNQLPGLASNWVAGLAVDASSGVLWVVDETGCISARRDGKFEAAAFRFSIHDEKATALSIEPGGSLWLATSGKEIYSIAPAQHLVVTNTQGWLGASTTQLLSDSQSQVWAISGEKVVTFANGRWRLNAGLENIRLPATAIARSRDGGLWVATISGYPIHNRGGRVFKLKDGQIVADLAPYPWPQDSHRTRITSLCEDHQGRLWAGTYGAGVFYWREGAGWQRLTDEGPLAQLIITSIVEGDEDTLLIASQGGELHRVTERKVIAIPPPPAAKENFILTACAARDGTIWVGTDGAGVFRYNNGHFEQESNGLNSLQVGVLIEDSRSNLWAGTWAGLHRWHGNHFEPVAESGPLTSVVLALTEDAKGNLWVCTDAGLVRLRDGEIKLFGQDEGIQHLYLRAVVEDAEGRICVASMDRGLYRQKGDRFEEVGAGKWEGATNIRALHADADGSLWIATYGNGLFRLKEGQFRQWSTQDGLPDAMLHCVVEDAGGNLWMSSDNGIFGCPKAAFEAYQRGRDRPLLCWHITAVDGLETKVCSGAGQPVAARSSDGRLWFPNQRSLAVFDPQQIPRGVRVWPAVIEEILVDGLPRLHGPEGMFNISSSARRFEIHYSSPNLIAAERLQFRHRIAGLEEDWVEAADRRVVFFNRLPPGRYEFQVMAGGPDGRWHDPPSSFGLEIIPQWWERRSFQAGAGVLSLGLVAGGVWMVARARLRRRLKDMEMHQLLEQERRRIARDLHDDVGSGLTEVVLLTEPTDQELATPEALKNQLLLAARKSRQLISAMRLVVWTVNPENDLLPNLADYLTAYAQEFLESTTIRCRLDIMAGLPTSRLYAKARHEILLAVKEALNNAVRHSRATEIWFRMRFEDGCMVIAVEDDGCGFDAVTAAGAGNGLGNMRERLESIGGMFEISSRPGLGASVRFRIQLSPNE